MVEIYTQELTEDSLENVMLAYGIDIKKKNNKEHKMNSYYNRN
jgi:hypothetical protein